MHDYIPGGRAPQWQSTVAEQRIRNPHLQDIDEQTYAAMHEQRDAKLPLPALMLAALQAIRGDYLPPAEGNDGSYLKIPVDYF